MEVTGKAPDDQHSRDKPRDRLDEGATGGSSPDEVLDQWDAGRSTDHPEGPAGSITNMEVLRQETELDSPETDPFEPEEERGNGPRDTGT